jgi:hypothetical protein
MSGKKTGVKVSDKAAHVENLVKKNNWPKIREMAAQGIQAAVDAVKKREAAKKPKS